MPSSRLCQSGTFCSNCYVVNIIVQCECCYEMIVCLSGSTCVRASGTTLLDNCIQDYWGTTRLPASHVAQKIRAARHWHGQNPWRMTHGPQLSPEDELIENTLEVFVHNIGASVIHFMFSLIEIWPELWPLTFAKNTCHRSRHHTTNRSGRLNAPCK